MRLSISAQVTVDLTAIGGRKGQFPGKLSYDDLGVPAEVEFDAVASSDDTINATTDRDKLAAIVGQQIVVATHHDWLVKTTLAALGRVSFHDGNTIRFNAHVGPSDTTTAAAAVANAATWRFDLANAHLRIGDEWVEHHLPAQADGAPRPNGRSCSRLRFVVEGREWTLTDELFRTRRNGAKPANVPVESATLTTPFVKGDTAAAVAAIALDVEQLLRLALCRDVRFVTVSALDGDGNLLTSASRAVHVEPEYVGGRPPVDNWHAGVLRSLIEAARPVVAADREWWHHTLALYWQAQAAKYLEIQTAILNILIDRITTRLVGDGGGAEIDADLPARLDDQAFAQSFHALLSTLSPHWSADRTQAVAAKIKEFNARPSFAKKIRRACDQLGVRAPSGREMSVRHVLLHLGELDAPGGNSAQYWIDLDALVLTLLLRMLNYGGPAYHSTFGPNEVIMANIGAA